MLRWSKWRWSTNDTGRWGIARWQLGFRIVTSKDGNIQTVYVGPIHFWRFKRAVPNWEAFGRAIMLNWPEGGVDGGDLQDTALKHDVLREIPGGFNPALHEDDYSCAEPGDSWFERNYTHKGV